MQLEAAVLAWVVVGGEREGERDQLVELGAWRELLGQTDHARLLAGLLLAGLGQVALNVAGARHVVVAGTRGGGGGGAHHTARAQGLAGAGLLLLWLLLLWLLQVLAEAAWLSLGHVGARLRHHRVQD